MRRTAGRMVALPATRPSQNPRSSRPTFRRGSTGCRGAAFHTLVVVALGITWILDGLEVTLAGAVAGALKASPRAAFSQCRCRPCQQRLSRRRGARRARLRLAHRPARAQAAVLHHACGLSRGHRRDRVLVECLRASALFRFLTGAGIGGEYTAINSTIQELVPARYRGWTDLVINGSFWVGAALGAAARSCCSIRRCSPPDLGWRARLPHRRSARPRHLRHAHVDPGIAALADDPRPHRRGRSDRRRRSRRELRAAACVARCAAPPCRASACARAASRRWREVVAHAVSRTPAPHARRA